MSAIGDDVGDTDLHFFLHVAGQKNYIAFPIVTSFFLHRLLGFTDVVESDGFDVRRSCDGTDDVCSVGLRVGDDVVFLLPFPYFSPLSLSLSFLLLLLSLLPSLSPLLLLFTPLFIPFFELFSSRSAT